MKVPNLFRIYKDKQFYTNKSTINTFVASTIDAAVKTAQLKASNAPMK